MRGLQECKLVSDNKYRVSFSTSEELERFKDLRGRLSKKLSETRRLNIESVPLYDNNEDRMDELDKSLMAQRNDSSRIAELIPQKDLTEVSERIIQDKKPISEADFLTVIPRTLVLNGISVKRQDLVINQDNLTGKPGTTKGIPTSGQSNHQLAVPKPNSGGMSDPKLSSTNLKKSSQNRQMDDPELEDINVFSSNLKLAPQRLVQKRRSPVNFRLEHLLQCAACDPRHSVGLERQGASQRSQGKH